MQAFPHHYEASASTAGDHVKLASPGVPELTTAAPASFDGPGDCWSPETMLMGAIANCFVLTFKAVAAASKFSYQDIECDVTGTLDKSDTGVRFVEALIVARLKLDNPEDAEKAEKLLQKSKGNCLVSNSLNTAITLESRIT